MDIKERFYANLKMIREEAEQFDEAVLGGKKYAGKENPNNAKSRKSKKRTAEVEAGTENRLKRHLTAQRKVRASGKKVDKLEDSDRRKSPYKAANKDFNKKYNRWDRTAKAIVAADKVLPKSKAKIPGYSGRKSGIDYFKKYE